MKTVSIRLEKAQDEELEEFAKKHNIDKSSAARNIIEEGLKVVKRDEAMKMVRLRKWTIWKAAEYCGESYRSFLGFLRQANVPFPLSAEDLEREMDEDRD
jgi:predicted transcriptional regulator